MEKKALRVLFIGNSHTYYNDMPLLVKRRFDEEGYDCHVTMLAHPAWFLAQHVVESETKFKSITANTIMLFCRSMPIRSGRRKSSSTL